MERYCLHPLIIKKCHLAPLFCHLVKILFTKNRNEVKIAETNTAQKTLQLVLDFIHFVCALIIRIALGWLP